MALIQKIELIIIFTKQCKPQFFFFFLEMYVRKEQKKGKMNITLFCLLHKFEYMYSICIDYSYDD